MSPERAQEETETVYEILDGVRRAKAAQLNGRETINATVNGVGPEFAVPIRCRRSPKDDIDLAGVRGMSWGKIVRATQSDVPLPPIEITPGSRGTPIAEVTVSEDEFDAFRRPS